MNPPRHYLALTFQTESGEVEELQLHWDQKHASPNEVKASIINHVSDCSFIGIRAMPETPLTVAELIVELQKLPPDALIARERFDYSIDEMEFIPATGISKLTRNEITRLEKEFAAINRLEVMPDPHAWYMLY